MSLLIDRPDLQLAKRFLREDRSAELASLSVLLDMEMCPHACCCERSCILLHPHAGPHECAEGHLWI